MSVSRDNVDELDDDEEDVEVSVGWLLTEFGDSDNGTE
jgi:hypothetical protein